jgi:hypothetical protein
MLRPVVTAGKRVINGFARRGAPVERAVNAAFETLENRRLLSVSISNGVLSITGTGVADSIVVKYIAGNTGELRVKGLGAGQIFSDAGISKIMINGGGGDDHITLSDVSGVLAIPARIHGGSGNVDLTGSSFGHDTLIGGGGIDIVQGSGNGNVIRAGTGSADTLIGGGADEIVQGPGDNLVSTNDGASFSVQDSSPLPDLSLPVVANSSSFQPYFTGVNNKIINGYTPEQLRAAYGYGLLNQPTTTVLGQGQTIVIVDAFDSPTIFNDLTVFSEQFGLPVPTAQNFEKVFATGVQPASNTSWDTEIALDVEWSHAMAPDANIILVEAATNSTNDLFNAVNVAGNLASNTPVGGGVVSMSFGETEETSVAANPTVAAQEYDLDRIFASYPSVSFCAASGDTGGELSYPATSPYVTGVGGTTLNLFGEARILPAEAAWTGSGGGTSAIEPAPVYQQADLGLATTAFREVPDVSMMASPGVAVYTASPNVAGDTGWADIGGTSLACPLFASAVALANQVRLTNNEPVIGNNLNNAIYNMNLNNLGADFGLGGTVGYAVRTGWGAPIVSSFINDLSDFSSAGSTPPIYALDANDPSIEATFTVTGSILNPILGNAAATDTYSGKGGDSIATGPTTFTLQLEGMDSLQNVQALTVACTINELTTGAFTGLLTGSGLFTAPTLPVDESTAILFQGNVTNGQNGGVEIKGSLQAVVVNPDGTTTPIGRGGVNGSGDGTVSGTFQSA